MQAPATALRQAREVCVPQASAALRPSAAAVALPPQTPYAPARSGAAHATGTLPMTDSPLGACHSNGRHGISAAMCGWRERGRVLSPVTQVHWGACGHVRQYPCPCRKEPGRRKVVFAEEANTSLPSVGGSVRRGQRPRAASSAKAAAVKAGAGGDQNLPSRCDTAVRVVMLHQKGTCANAPDYIFVWRHQAAAHLPTVLNMTLPSSHWSITCLSTKDRLFPHCTTLQPAVKLRGVRRTPFKLRRAPLEGLDANLSGLGTRLRALSLSADPQQEAPRGSHGKGEPPAGACVQRGPVMLILDECLQGLPWESLPALRSQRCDCGIAQQFTPPRTCASGLCKGQDPVRSRSSRRLPCTRIYSLPAGTLLVWGVTGA